MKDDQVHLHRSHYIQPDDRKKQPHTKLNPKELTMLRGLLGALQWLSAQTAPYMECGVSQLAREFSTATASTIDKGNKLLRQAKATARRWVDLDLPSPRRLSKKSHFCWIL